MTDIDLLYLFRDAITAHRATEAWNIADQISEYPFADSNFGEMVYWSYLLSKKDLENVGLDPEPVSELLDSGIHYVSDIDPIYFLTGTELLDRIRYIIGFLISDKLDEVFSDPDILRWSITCIPSRHRLEERSTTLGLHPDVIETQLHVLTGLVDDSNLLRLWISRGTHYKLQLPEFCPVVDVDVEADVYSFVPFHEVLRQARYFPQLRQLANLLIRDNLAESLDLSTTTPSVLLELYDRDLLTGLDIRIIAVNALLTHQARVLATLLDNGLLPQGLDYIRQLVTSMNSDTVMSIIDMDTIGWTSDINDILPVYNINNTWQQLANFLDKHRPVEQHNKILIRMLDILSACIADDTGEERIAVVAYILDNDDNELLHQYVADNQQPRDRIAQWRRLKDENEAGHYLF